MCPCVVTVVWSPSSSGVSSGINAGVAHADDVGCEFAGDMSVVVMDVVGAVLPLAGNKKGLTFVRAIVPV